MKDQLKFENELELKIRISTAKHEIDIRCELTDLTFVFSLPTAQKLIKIIVGLNQSLENLETEKNRVRKAKLQMYEFILQGLSR
jgi:hypothetical protein